MKTQKSVKVENCPVTYTMGIIGGKWKPIVIHLIDLGENRFGLLQKRIEGISKQMLTKQLRELETDGIVHREIFAEIPPRVEYSITKKGKTLFPVIKSMRDWGNTYKK